MKFQLLLVLSIAFHTYTSSSRLPLENRIVGAFKMKLKLFVILFVASFIRASPPNRGFFNPRYSFSERIVGGNAVEIEDYPYQVYVSDTWGRICGGTVISDQYILTAAHCIDRNDAKNFEIRLGSTYNSNGGYVVKVENVTVHPKYDSITVDCDFSLLKLNTKLQFGRTVQPAKLPEQDQSPSPGTMCVVSGWGNTQNPSESREHLRATSVPFVDQNECNKAYSDVYGVTPRMICAAFKNGGKDSCKLCHKFQSQSTILNI
uniref:trypsin n=1 Tax=Culicoides sonorensis TaxID=179676 RepID=A0A336LFU1_CULSO